MTEKKYKYAVVDLEATGAHSQAKIIQVGIVIIEDGQITQTYETDINPHEPLDYHIQELTGLTNQRLAKAPNFNQVAREIYDLIEDAIFVAHNVKFDANLLAEELFWEGFDLLTPRVDTVELSQVFFPRIERHGLSTLSQRLELPLEQAHTAISDALATAHLFLKIQERISQLPKPLVGEILKRSSCLLYESNLVIEEVYAKMTESSLSNYKECQGLFLPRAKGFPREREFSTDFSKNIALLGLEERKIQEDVAQKVQELTSEETVNFIEAPTGIGKTLAYLLPILAQKEASILLVVPTKALQNQLMEQEAARINEVFSTSFHSIKGVENYIKLDSFYQSLQREDENRLVQKFKLSILVWLTETSTGDLEELGQVYRHQAFFDELRHDGHLLANSLFAEEDFWKINQEKAKNSRVLVTNQAYFLKRLEDDKSFLGNRFLIIDEAQKLFLTLEEFSRKSTLILPILQEIQERIATSSDLLTRRLLESIQHQLTSSLDAFRNNHIANLKEEKIEHLYQDLTELPVGLLEDLRPVFQGKKESIWFSDAFKNGTRVTSLNSARWDFLNFAQLLPETTPVLFVSATLDISSKIRLADLLGFSKYGSVKIEGEFAKKQEILLLDQEKNIAELTLEEQGDFILQQIEKCASLKIPILCLFTSKELLLSVSDRLRLPHLAQYKNGEASNIKRRFDRGEALIVLGTASFWEGMDFASHPKMIEIITRIPFDNPSDPFVKKLNRKLREEGKNPFYDYSLPLAILRLKQAIGRSKRSANQESAIILLDNRCLYKRYSKQIQSSLKQLASVKTVEAGQLVNRLQEFFRDTDIC